jgi:hypothetical protein
LSRPFPKSWTPCPIVDKNELWNAVINKPYKAVFWEYSTMIEFQNEINITQHI